MNLRQYLLLGFSVAVANMSSAEAASAARVASVTWNSDRGRFQLHDTNQTSRNIAWGVFTDDRNKTGWSSIEVHTNELYLDDQQAFAAGLVEGLLTQNLIQEQFQNQFKNYCEENHKFCFKLFNYLHANVGSMVANVAAYGGSDPYWHQVGLSLNQIAGMQMSLSNSADFVYVEDNLVPAVYEWTLLNFDGDLSDLETKFNRTKAREDYPTGSGSCSAIVKMAPGNRDVYFAHATWSDYCGMNRILKKYHLNYHRTPMSKNLIPGRSIVFSGYPGKIFSYDDFCLINTGLAVMETTIENNNGELWRKVTPIDTVPTSIRNMVANRLAITGQDWTNIFAKFNSGTYNNQWMVLDYKLFDPTSKKLPKNLLWILEQMPGCTMSKDVTSVLEKQGYWASYNSPYFQKISNKSGFPALVKKYGDWYSYDKTPRALIFKRDQKKAVDIPSVMKLLRYNDFVNDPLSRCTSCEPPYNAANAISARNELNPANGSYPFKALSHLAYGGTDTKVVNSALFWRQEFYAVSGPTWDDQPPFRWSTSGFDNISHVGHPDLWNFKPVLARWAL